MAVRYYSSLDTGAPVLPGTTGQRFFDNLRLILKACLVDGYGAKPAAGWTVGHEHTEGFSLFNGDGYVNFAASTVSGSTNNGVDAYLIESITDGSTAVAGGYNRRSGPWFDGQTTASRQSFFGGTFYSTIANKQWCLVADDKTAIFSYCGGSNVSVDMSTVGAGTMYFGAYTSALGTRGLCCLGGNTSPSSNAYMALPTTNAGTCLRNPFNGTVDQGVSPGYRTGAPTDSGNIGLYSKPIVSALFLRPVRAVLLGVGAGVSGSTGTQYAANCGMLRGLMSDPALSDNYLSKVLNLLGKSSPAYADRVRPVTLPNGNQWVPLYPYTGDAGLFASLDPSDWS